MAFGQRISSGKGSKSMRPPKPVARTDLDGFDKKAWVQELKMLKKDQGIEMRDRYRPLLCLK